MDIPYMKNDATDMIEIVIDPQELMQRYIELGIVDYPQDEYKENCIDMCNISTFTIGQALAGYCEDGQLIVKEGVFGMMGNHTWLEVEGIIIDATLCQFVPDAKPLSLIDASWDKYTAVKEYEFFDWVRDSPNVM